MRPRGVLPSPEVAFGLDGLCTLTRARGRPEEGETIRGKQLNGERTGVLQFGGKLDRLTRGTDGDGAGRLPRCRHRPHPRAPAAEVGGGVLARTEDECTVGVGHVPCRGRDDVRQSDGNAAASHGVDELQLEAALREYSEGRRRGSELRRPGDVVLRLQLQRAHRGAVAVADDEARTLERLVQWAAGADAELGVLV